MGEKLFVYGTLRNGEKNADKLAGAAQLAEQCWTKGALFETEKGYPAFIIPEDEAESGLVYGELYELDEDQLAQADRFEGFFGENHPENLYDRIKLSVQTDQGTGLAWIYVLNPFHHGILSDPVNHYDWKTAGYLKDNDEFLYFAYGSCMDDDRFKKANVDHHFADMAGRGTAPGYQLKFGFFTGHSGAADIVETGGKVEGKVYRVKQDALDYLFQREGVFAGNYRPAVITVDLEGSGPMEVLTFLVLDKHEETAPTEIYATEILRGGRGTLSDEYLEQLAEKIKTDFDMEITLEKN